MKKIISVLIAVMMVFGAVAIPASAQEDTSRRIYFHAREEWQEDGTLYAHIWNSSTGEFATKWQSEHTQLKMLEDGDREFWYYDVPLPKEGEKEWDSIIFSHLGNKDKVSQTYGATFGEECFGEMAYVVEQQIITSPIDSSGIRELPHATWYELEDKYGPHIYITPSGEVLGNFLHNDETPEKIVADFVEAYGPTSDNYKPSLVSAEMQAKYLEWIFDATVTNKPKASTLGYAGDVNGDHVVDLEDVLIMSKHIAKLIILDDTNAFFGDVDNAEGVELEDMLMVQRYVAQLEVPIVGELTQMGGYVRII